MCDSGFKREHCTVQYKSKIPPLPFEMKKNVCAKMDTFVIDNTCNANKTNHLLRVVILT